MTESAEKELDTTRLLTLPPTLELEVNATLEVEPFLATHEISLDTLACRLRGVCADPRIASLLPARGELCLTLMSDAEIHELNRDYRDQDKPTDVLSFALLEGETFALPPELPTPLGDLMISVETALRQAARGVLPRLVSAPVSTEMWSLTDELSFLALHGLLHVLGYDHESDEEAEEMEALELNLLSVLLG